MKIKVSFAVNYGECNVSNLEKQSSIGFVIYVASSTTEIYEAAYPLFAQNNLDVYLFDNGEDFLIAAKMQPADCVIIDISSSRFDGIRLHQSLLNFNFTPLTLFVLNRGDISKATWSIRSGAADIIEKPFSTQRFLNTVKKVLYAD